MFVASQKCIGIKFTNNNAYKTMKIYGKIRENDHIYHLFKIRVWNE